MLINHLDDIKSCKVIDNETESRSNNKHDKTNCDRTDIKLEKRESLSDLVKHQSQSILYSGRDKEKQKAVNSRETSSKNKNTKNDIVRDD